MDALDELDDLWEHETPAADHIDVPAWIEQDIGGRAIEAICQGGCASGAYMPAVTYHSALATMSEHGDDVLQYIEDTMGEIPAPPDQFSWRELASHYLSCAVEIWASGAQQELLDALNAERSE